MKNITVNKAKLLSVLKKNRAEHRKIFEEAVEGYRAQAIKLLDEQLERAKAGKRFILYIQLIEPVDQTKDYDRAIGMLEMDMSKKIELSETDYRNYILDEWGWKGQFLSSNKDYSRTAAVQFAAGEIFCAPNTPRFG